MSNLSKIVHGVTLVGALSLSIGAARAEISIMRAGLQAIAATDIAAPGAAAAFRDIAAKAQQSLAAHRENRPGDPAENAGGGQLTQVAGGSNFLPLAIGLANSGIAAKIVKGVLDQVPTGHGAHQKSAPGHGKTGHGASPSPVKLFQNFLKSSAAPPSVKADTTAGIEKDIHNGPGAFQEAADDSDDCSGMSYKG